LAKCQMPAKDSVQNSMELKIVLLALILMPGEVDAHTATVADSQEKRDSS